MWHVVKLHNKRDKEAAERLMSLKGKAFYSLEQLTEMYGAQPAIVSQLHMHVPFGYLIEDWNEPEEENEKEDGLQKYFQRVKVKRRQKEHLQLSQTDFDQLVRVLQTPLHYRVLAVPPPSEDELKPFIAPYGPLQGLQGRFLNRKTPGGKRIYVRVLNSFNLEIKVPIIDVKLPKKDEEEVTMSYLSDDDTPYWYVLTAHRKEYLERITEGTLTPWVLREQLVPVQTKVNTPKKEAPRYTTRYVFQTIYKHYDEEGKTQEINLLPNYYFLRTTRYDLETFRSTDHNSHVYILRNIDGTPVRVPETQIEGFNRFLQERSEATEAIFGDFREGDTAYITIGRETNNEVEGTVQIVTKKHVVIVNENGFKIQVRKEK